MEHFAGLDVSVKETAICVVDELGKVCREAKVASHPEDLLRVLKDSAADVVRLVGGPPINPQYFAVWKFRKF